tara:strand:+ start:52 stop:531 length:480 start_codon:yes stop_codon:yes gene_type:complete
MKIIDNLLDKEDFLKIKNLYTSNEMFWNYREGIDSVNSKRNDFFFYHTLYDQNVPKTNFFGSIIPIFNKLGIVKSLIRVKANLYTRTNTIEHHADHTDFPWEHKTAIFYINSNNGFTVLKDGTKVESIENRLLLFNGFEKHHSTSCTDGVRININFNYF